MSEEEITIDFFNEVLEKSRREIFQNLPADYEAKYIKDSSVISQLVELVMQVLRNTELSGVRIFDAALFGAKEKGLNPYRFGEFISDIEFAVVTEYGEGSHFLVELKHSATHYFKQLFKEKIAEDGLHKKNIRIEQFIEQRKIRSSEDISLENDSYELDALKEILAELNTGLDLKKAEAEDTVVSKDIDKRIPPRIRENIINEAAKLTENHDKWNEYNLIEALGISKSTFYVWKNHFGFSKLTMIRDEAKKKIKEKR